MDHLYEKFPLMESFNGKLRLRSTYPAAIRIWKHVEETFKNNWIEHWNRYKNCKHNYIPCNLASNDIDKLFKSKPKENSVFWWNGALKHLSANVLKTSNDSHRMSINFIQIHHIIQIFILNYFNILFYKIRFIVFFDIKNN